MNPEGLKSFFQDQEQETMDKKRALSDSVLEAGGQAS